MKIDGHNVYLDIDDPLCQEITDMLKRFMKSAVVKSIRPIHYLKHNDLFSDTEIYIYCGDSDE